MHQSFAAFSYSAGLKLLALFAGLLLTTPVCAQTAIGVYTSPDLNRSPDYFTTGKTSSKLGITTGLAVRTGLSNRWSVLYGVQYAAKQVVSTGYLASLTVTGVQETLTEVVGVKQRQRLIEVPLQLRYGLSSGNSRWTPYVQAGVVGSWVLRGETEYNSRRRSEAVTIPLDVSSGLGIATEAGVGVAYSLGKHLEVNVQPTFRLELDDAPSISRLGLGTTLMYKF
ncbi:outer membrane beta-barrel protein [Hymenobacter lutimineralis]